MADGVTGIVDLRFAPCVEIGGLLAKRKCVFISVHPRPFVVQLVCEHYEFEPGHGHRCERVAGGDGRPPHFARRGDAPET